MRVFNFGSMNIDHVYEVENIVKPGETITSFSYEKLIGGKGLNQSIALAKAEVDVYHLGSVGHDGLFLLDTLKSVGTNVEHIQISSTPTGHAIIQLAKSGNNSIVLYPGANHQISKEYIDEMFNLISEKDMLLLQNEISNLDYIVDKAYERNISVVLNLAPVTKEALSLDFNKITTLLINEAEGEALVNETDPHLIGKVLTEKYPKLEVVLTLGDQGSMYFKEQESVTYGIYDCKVVDTTAAGDTFTGYYLAGRIQGFEVKKALNYASCASSMSVEVKGAANSIPHKEDVLIRFKENR